MEKITVVINTLNAGSTLEQCLLTVSGFDEIVVCDMYSTDNTVEIAKRFGCKIIYHERTGYVEPARNFAISASTNAWVLVLDADELVSKDLKEYLYKQTEQAEEAAGLLIPRINFYMGKQMRALYPDYQLRFFVKEKTTWSDHIHSKPKVEGPIKKIAKSRRDCALVHIEPVTLSQKIEKLNIYTEKEIPKRMERAESYSILSAMLKSYHRFFKYYFVKGGILDGRIGYARAKFESMYHFVMIAKMWEHEQQGKKTDKDRYISEYCK